MSKRFLVLIASGVLVAALGWADDDDPPGRAARLSFIAGTVSFQPGSVEDWVPATLNRPMTTGDRLWTEAGSRAEMTIGSAAVRLNSRTNFAFLNLDDRTTQIQVSVGSLSVRLRRLADDESFEIDTPQMALTLLRPGEYRIDVNDEGDATVVGVRGGSAEAVAGSQTYTMRPLEQLRASGTDQVVFDERPIPPADAFDNFCEGRDRREDTSQSARYVSRDVPGYSDLDNTGTWRQEPDYGPVWIPSGVQPDWAPYHYGHWAWIAPWGWTWVDDAPWGYAPFHYGRWVFVGGAWGWVPGPIVARPVYAPAMVAWVGGGGFGIGIGVGVGPAVGWFPLGPREVWVPAYHYSPAYIERVNVSNTVIVNRTVFNNVNVTNVTYVNRNVRGAVTVVPQNQMIAGRPVASAAVRVPPEAMARAQVQSSAAVAPERGAVLGGRAAVSAAPPAAVMNRQIAARQLPPPAPVPFAQQQQTLRQNPGQPIPRGSLTQVQQQQGPQPGGGTGTRPQFRQVGPPPAAGVPSQGGPPRVPAQAGTRNIPGQAVTPQQPQPEFRRGPQNTPPAQENNPPQARPEFRRGPENTPPAPAPNSQTRPALDSTPQQTRPELRRAPENTPTAPAPNSQTRPAQEATPQQPRPEFRRPQNPAPPPAPPAQPAQPASQQPEIRRAPPANNVPQNPPASGRPNGSSERDTKQKPDNKRRPDRTDEKK
jgi:hypothetical protein